MTSRITAAVVAALVTLPIADLVSADSRNKSHVFVSQSGGMMSMLECRTDGKRRHGWWHGKPAIECEEEEVVDVGFSTSWPANQYRGDKHWWWSGLSGEVIAVRARNHLKQVPRARNTMRVNTYDLPGIPAGRRLDGSNFIGVTPDGKRAWNAAREIDEIQEIDADPNSPTFGQILHRISVPLSAAAAADGGRNGRMRPCDMSITPDGRYLWEPDLAGETVTGVDLKTRQVVAQLRLEPLNPSERVRPFMLTTNGRLALVENFEAPTGTYSVIDVSDPHAPVELKRITPADGLGVSPQTSEFTPDGRYAYLITNGSPSIPGSVDVLDLETLQIVKKLALPDNCRPHTGDFSNDGHFFFLNCSRANSVAVIDNRLQQVVTEVALAGTSPRGVITR